MRAVWIESPGGPEVLSIREVETPVPSRGEVRLRVAAAGLNRADVLQRRGFYPAPPGTPASIPGLEVAGTVDAVGAGNASGWREGDRAMAVVPGGGMAEFVCLPVRELLPVPEGLELHDAAAIPEAFSTAFDALAIQASIGAGDVVLVHAVGSGVGTAACQWLRAAGARSIGTSRTEDKLKRAVALGLDVGILANDAMWDAIRDVAPDGVSAVLDLVGGAYVEQGMRCTRTGGTIMLVGLLGGVTGTLSFSTLLSKRLHLVGTVLRTRMPEERAFLAAQVRRRVIPLFQRGLLRPVVDRILPMEEVAAAHHSLEANDSFGKVVLTW